MAKSLQHIVHQQRQNLSTQITQKNKAQLEAEEKARQLRQERKLFEKVTTSSSSSAAGAGAGGKNQKAKNRGEVHYHLGGQTDTISGRDQLEVKLVSGF